MSIAYFMGLTGFALTMIACDLVFLSGALDRALLWVRGRIPGSRASRSGRTSRADTTQPTTPQAELV
ncbi:hypothetical protein ACH4C6_08395 [Streptomyces sp. NPDC017943]|uniref:hypothetical protein n=1 Tax=Streptomyces sp. NPDC017943 TaxID=3365019 RepID=UPI00379707B2